MIIIAIFYDMLFISGDYGIAPHFCNSPEL